MGNKPYMITRAEFQYLTDKTPDIRAVLDTLDAATVVEFGTLSHLGLLARLEETLPYSPLWIQLAGWAQAATDILNRGKADADHVQPLFLSMPNRAKEKGVTRARYRAILDEQGPILRPILASCAEDVQRKFATVSHVALLFFLEATNGRGRIAPRLVAWLDMAIDALNAGREDGQDLFPAWHPGHTPKEERDRKEGMVRTREKLLKFADTMNVPERVKWAKQWAEHGYKKDPAGRDNALKTLADNYEKFTDLERQAILAAYFVPVMKQKALI